MTYLQILRISRPRFWIYLLGPALVASAVLFRHTSDFITSPTFWIILLYFSFPANFFVYGVNDIFDYETDKKNPKKQTYEGLLSPKRHTLIWVRICITNLPFLVFFFTSLGTLSKIALAVFLFLSLFYSAKPIRAKTKPFLDSLFNILYIFPGLIIYTQYSNNLSLPLLFGACAWSMAMHAYSAIPDILPDTQANTPTIATVLGFSFTLGYCFLLYLFASVILSQFIPWLGVLFGIIYCGMMILTFLKKEAHAFTLYTSFPFINTLMGFILFIAIFF